MSYRTTAELGRLARSFARSLPAGWAFQIEDAVVKYRLTGSSRQRFYGILPDELRAVGCYEASVTLSNDRVTPWEGQLDPYSLPSQDTYWVHPGHEVTVMKRISSPKFNGWQPIALADAVTPLLTP